MWPRARYVERPTTVARGGTRRRRGRQRCYIERASRKGNWTNKARSSRDDGGEASRRSGDVTIATKRAFYTCATFCPLPIRHASLFACQRLHATPLTPRHDRDTTFIMHRPSLLVREQPLDALCHHFGVQPTPPGTPVPAVGTFDMPIYVTPRRERDRDAPPPLPTPPPPPPTHVLAASAPEQPGAPPLMLPIDAALFARGFPLDLPFDPDAPSTARTPTGTALRLPVVSLFVPHPGTLPLLLLFGMGLEREANVMAWALLPVSVVEEFPNAAAMALVLARVRPERFERVYRHNQGLWRNVLALGLSDGAMYQLVQTAWNVTAEARRIRQRGAM